MYMYADQRLCTGGVHNRFRNILVMYMCGCVRTVLSLVHNSRYHGKLLLYLLTGNSLHQVLLCQCMDKFAVN